MRGLLVLLIFPLSLAVLATTASAQSGDEEAAPQNDWMIHMDKSTGSWRYLPARPVLVPGGQLQLMVFGPGQFSLILDGTGQGADISTKEGTIRTAEFAAPTEPGEYPFHDKYHPEARGVLIVREPTKPAVVIGVVPGGYESTFAPARTEVSSGALVTFRANGSFGHNLQSVDGLFTAGDLRPGEDSTFTAPTMPGEYAFECRFHKEQGMVGTLVVIEAAPAPRPKADAKSADIVLADNEFVPKEITLEPGARVTIHNAGATPHTVTASDGSFDSGRIEPGATVTLQLPDSARPHRIYCRYHAAPHSPPDEAMAGVITLRATPDAAMEHDTRRDGAREASGIALGGMLLTLGILAFARARQDR